MNWDQLAAQIEKMSPKQRGGPVLIFDGDWVEAELEHEEHHYLGPIANARVYEELFDVPQPPNGYVFIPVDEQPDLEDCYFMFGVIERAIYDKGGPWPDDGVAQEIKDLLPEGFSEEADSTVGAEGTFEECCKRLRGAGFVEGTLNYGAIK